MNLSFQYDKAKDVWCILNKGKSSTNSPTPTKVYEQLVAEYGENPSAEMTASFIDTYISKNNINLNEYLTKVEKDWETVTGEFQKRAEAIFGTSLPNTITAYLTINNRCPYSLVENYFYISVSGTSASRTIMHELWHFYTWYGLGVDQEEKLGKQKYNDLKESLTVLLNVECVDLLPPGVSDTGYPQHQQIRENILEFWKKDKNIFNLWKYLSEQTLS